MNVKPYDVFYHCWPSSDVPSAGLAHLGTWGELGGDFFAKNINLVMFHLIDRDRWPAGGEDVADDLGDEDVIHVRFGVLGFHSDVDHPDDGQCTR